MKHLALAFSIDYRSLRLCRLALGILLVAEAIHFAFAIEPFFSEVGMFPLRLQRPCLSLFCLSPSSILPWVGTFILALTGVALIYNWHVRTAALVAFIILRSFDARSPIIMYGADNLLRTLIFWSIFLPLGPPPGGAKRFTSFASVIALLQVAAVYITSGFLKSTQVWWVDGLAVFSVLHGDLYLRPLGDSLAQLPLWLHKLASRVVLQWERFGPILFFCPYYFPWARLVAFAGFALMHATFAVSLYIGLFPLVDIVFLLLLIPGEFWDYFSRFRFFDALPPLREFEDFRWWRVATTPSLLFVLACMVVWNLKRLEVNVPVPAPTRGLVRTFGFNQMWTMFAPAPFTADGWFVVQGETVSHFPVDLLKMKRGWADFRKPKVVVSSLPTERWISTLISLAWERGLEAQRLALADYYCAKWNRNNLEALAKVKVWFVSEPTQGPQLPQYLISYLLIAKDCSE